MNNENWNTTKHSCDSVYSQFHSSCLKPETVEIVTRYLIRVFATVAVGIISTTWWKALEKTLALKDGQVIERQRAAVRGLKAIYSGQLIVDIKRDLASGNMTVEKHIQMDVDVGKALEPNPMGKIPLELILPEPPNALRTNLKNQLL